jgi:TolB protein
MMIIIVVLILVAPLPAHAGSDIVYSSFKSGSWQIWTMNPETGEDRQVTREKGDVRFPSWSPDRKKIAFATNEGKIRIMDKDGSEKKTLELLEGKCDQPSWHPSGKSLVYTAFTFEGEEASDIWEVPLGEDREFRPSRVVAGEGIEQFPIYGARGKTLLYTRFHRDPWRRVVEELVVRDLETKTEYLLTTTGKQNFYPDWSPDGKSVVFASNMTGDYEIWMIGSEPTRLIRLTTSPGLDTQPRWSPDGNKIVFVSTRSGTKQLWSMHKDGENPRRLSKGNAECKDPDW